MWKFCSQRNGIVWIRSRVSIRSEVNCRIWIMIRIETYNRSAHITGHRYISGRDVNVGIDRRRWTTCPWIPTRRAWTTRWCGSSPTASSCRPAASWHPLYTGTPAALRIRDILVRIRIRWSLLLTYGSGSGSSKNIRIRIRNTWYPFLQIGRGRIRKIIPNPFFRPARNSGSATECSVLSKWKF